MNLEEAKTRAEKLCHLSQQNNGAMIITKTNDMKREEQIKNWKVNPMIICLTVITVVDIITTGGGISLFIWIGYGLYKTMD